MAANTPNAPAPASAPAVPDAPDASATKKIDQKRADKAAKFAAKQAKTQQQKPASQPVPKAPKTQAPELPPFVNDTPPGEKKVLRSFDDPHFQAYNPKAVEAAWYQWWEKSGFFRPETSGSSEIGTFVIPLPPPNVTGALHCGHALANSLQDTLIRWYRMRGFKTVWVPGCDHAGISTQSVVEKMLWKKEKKTRIDLGREDFTKLVWEWKDDYHKRINNAQRLMGGSMDWTREAFTMDENFTAATKENFCRLYEEGLIYRSDRLVNWCTHLNTALSGLEVDNKNINGRTMLDVPGYDKKVEFGVLTYFKYPIEGEDQTIEVATTRPETMLGDSGIAVNPEDPRYTHLVGKFARHPFTDRLLKIVADTYVDKEFGTGAVKLTPAHDFNDYQLGQRHGLEFINILNDNGTLNENAGPRFQGQRRFDARYTVVEELTNLGLFVKKEPHAMTIPLCNKSNDVIEPYMKAQWWVRMQGMADEALRVVEEGQIKIAPESALKSYQRWLSNINDWCISRQLWWGHRIPAYRVIFEDGNNPQNDDGPWVIARSTVEAVNKAEARFGPRKFHLEQDPDCLDTWFSSGLWPMGVMGWPNTESSDYKDFFPTSLLETGWDILFFWVGRMIMLSLKLTGRVPFNEVYCHSLIRDSDGRKMSKSLGNVIDPLDIINGIELQDLHAKLLVGNLKEDEVKKATKYQQTAFPSGIPECGADALRFTLLSYTTGGGDISFDIKVMHAYRRFCNKVWQASKYVLGKLPQDFVPLDKLDTAALSVPERWILHRMNTAVKGVNEALEAREFSRSTKLAYQFFYDELCDVFIENSKSILSDGTPAEQQSVQQTLYRTLDIALRLLHPFLPFITEELWQRLPRGKDDSKPSVMLALYPTHDAELEFVSDAEVYELGLQCAGGLRSLASDYNIRSDGRAFIKIGTADGLAKVSAQLPAIKTLCGKGIAEVNLLGPDADEASKPSGCAVYVVSADIAVLLQVSGQITDIDAEIKKITTKLQKTNIAIKKQQDLLTGEGVEKVSDAVLTTERKKLADSKSAKENYEKTLEEFSKLKVGADSKA
ncbi:tRNA synthetases class I-domain-containing protein [Lasiosphaeria miniovina]|uniref:Valine--tRNA ligase, mitochondrial n=1 Tax=Lasiosphaeria miniovina TaxID=1954250 RepID=A0AA39ZT27_9PEZI|nr:tRNA synthetases class I-domain-containing protein [Lasiosphaeria miniovina]KAK0703065.1 tRNA synthetases class I-domain-containing protein [Lasiosphaeria miniovina]